MPIRQVLIIEEDPTFRETLAEVANKMGYRSNATANGVEGLRLVSALQPDIVLASSRAHTADGKTFVEAVSRSMRHLPIIVLAGNDQLEQAFEFLRNGAKDCLMKPCSANTISIVLRRVHHALQLERENAYLRSLMKVSPEIVAESPSMRSTLESARRFANSNGTVLISGEAGTGKGRLAQFIHFHSPRANGPFVRVNCSGLPERALNDTLFGNRFENTSTSAEGAFQDAAGGTILLDEVGSLTPDLQIKLLRMLEKDEARAESSRPAVRVFATSSQDLSVDVSKGRFREDLYYRLNILPLPVLPLRNRREDILPLTKHFMRLFSKKSGLPIPQLGEEAAARLMSWSWPGNVRELENVIQRAVLISRGKMLETKDFLLSTSSVGRPSMRQNVSFEASGPANLVNRKLADIEREAILATLEATGGNKTEAARRLGVSARTLSNKMKIWRQAGLVA